MKLPVTTVMKDYCHYAHNAYSKKKKIFSTVSYMFLIIVSLFSSNIMYSSPVAYGQTADPVLPVISVTASGNDGNVPSSAFDNNLATRWSDEGVGSFIQADLGSGTLKTVTSLEIAWYKGSERNNHFVISTSATGATGSFTTVFSGDSARTNSFQSYDVADTNARYVRVTVNGNTQNDWASINEIRIRGIAGADNTPPTVVSTSPVDQATGVSATANVVATFSEPMSSSTVTAPSSFTLVRTSDSANIPAVVSYSSGSNTATLNPTSSLTAGTRYTATITTAVTDLAGNHLAANKVWSFTVAGTIDTTPPTVVSTSPVDQATGVSATANVVATFSEPMSSSTVTAPSSFTLVRTSDSVNIPAVVTLSPSNTATLNPTSSLTAGTRYTATITTAVTDLAGNHLAANKVWSFTVAGTIDTTPPTVVSTSPSSVPPEPTDVSATANVVATFSEPVSSSTVTAPSSFTLVQASNGANIPAVVTLSPSNTATLDPTSSLTAGTRYTATITTAVTDLTGNHLQTNKVWSFTVAASGGGGNLDQFGITQIYPDKSGGEKWFMSANPNNDPRTDPQTTLVQNPDGSWNVQDDAARYNVFTSSGYHPNLITTYNQQALATKGYMQSANDWKNVEMTGVVKFNSGDSGDSWTWYARGGRHYSEGCEGTAYKADLFYNGRVRIAKEQWHVSYVFSSTTTPSPSASSIDKFVGFKAMIYNRQVGGETVVTTEIWVDRNPDSPTLKNNWQKVYTFTDSGGFGNEGEDCGGDPDQIITWGGPIATFRWDNADDVDIKKFSVREIQPPI